MLCRKCNGVIPDGAAFCPSCGTPVAEKIEAADNVPRYCTECGTEIPSGEDSCPKCNAEKTIPYSSDEKVAKDGTTGPDSSDKQEIKDQEEPKKQNSYKKIGIIGVGVVLAILLFCSETVRLLACFVGMVLFPISLVIWIICRVRKKPQKTWGIAMIVSAICVVLYFLLPTTCTEHDWAEATCTEPRTCSVCGETEGDVLGHDWTEATCASPKTCSRCGETEGDTLEHTPGEWEVTTAPTKTSEGEQAIKCTVCGEVLETEEIEKLPEMTADEYKAQCQSYAYDTIARNPGAYDGSYAKFSGYVLQVQQDELWGDLYYTLRIATVGKYDGVVYVSYTTPTDAPRILEDDYVTMWGQLTGEKTYTTVMGNSITIPSFTAEYIE